MSRQPPVFTRTDTLCLYTTRFLSESFGAWTMGDDAAMLAVVTTANVACGFHAGDWTVMQNTVDEAVKNGVSIGAHPSYPDLQGFGRRPMTMSNREVEALMAYQIGALIGIAATRGGKVTHEIGRAHVRTPV